jgi:ABC-type glycerol-3-phosphate transport system substrate-binding protein
MVLKTAPHPQEAVDFLKYVVGAEAQEVLVEQGGVGVTRRGIGWPAVLEDASKAASNATSLLNVYGGVGISYADFYTRILGPVHDSMFLGQITPEAFVQRMAAETKAYWQNK